MYLFTLTKDCTIVSGASFTLNHQHDTLPYISTSAGVSMYVTNELLLSPDALLWRQKNALTLMKASVARLHNGLKLLVPDTSGLPSPGERTVLLHVAGPQHTILSWCSHPIEASPAQLLPGLVGISVGQELIVSSHIWENRGSRFSSNWNWHPKAKFPVAFDGNQILVDGKSTTMQLTAD